MSLVTGAARGIGQAIADRLAANGSRVVYTDLDAAATEQRPRTRRRVGAAAGRDQPDEIAAVVDGRSSPSAAGSTSW